MKNHPYDYLTEFLPTDTHNCLGKCIHFLYNLPTENLVCPSNNWIYYWNLLLKHQFKKRIDFPQTIKKDHVYLAYLYRGISQVWGHTVIISNSEIIYCPHNKKELSNLDDLRFIYTVENYKLEDYK